MTVKQNGNSSERKRSSGGTHHPLRLLHVLWRSWILSTGLARSLLEILGIFLSVFVHDVTTVLFSWPSVSE